MIIQAACHFLNEFLDLFANICYTYAMETFRVKKLAKRKTIEVSVPASKSILNRALILAALYQAPVRLICGAYGEDTRALLGCFRALGIRTESDEQGLTVYGCGGNIPCKNAELDVKSAGTAARFLPPLLAFCGGNYRFVSSEQMAKRPMSVLPLLRQAGADVVYEQEADRFPFRLISNGILTDSITVNTDESTQYASGLLMAAGAQNTPFTVKLTGNRTNGSYIAITLSMMQAFGFQTLKNGTEITVSAPLTTAPLEYAVEPDLSGACYFYALSLLTGAKVLVRGVRSPSLQGDAAFLTLLQDRGVTFTETDKGLLADGGSVSSYRGFDENMRDFSDQTLTVAALAPFAETPSVLKNVGHIRKQECDRIAAICENLTAIGVPASADENNIYIQPAPVKGGLIKTFHDHRVAMAFSLIGLKTGNIVIENPDCCRKTFDGFFDILSELTNR